MEKSIFSTQSLARTMRFAQNSPMNGWYWENGITLNEKYFCSVADSYKEQDGWAYIENLGKIHYWLYNTITYHDGNSELIYNKYVPKWVEDMGYVIDFDHIHISEPNNILASSVRALMKQRGCNISVALIEDIIPYIVINEYFADKNIYKTTIYPLIK